MYDDLVKQLREVEGMLRIASFSEAKSLVAQAADAIEELTAIAESYKRSMEAWADEAARAQSRWIPVTERLPEMHEEVLVCNKYYGETALGYSTVAVWDGSDWICTWDMESRLHCITHWMPLPPAPESQKEKA